MKMAPASPTAVAAFEALTPPSARVRLVFGQPAAFVNGNMFFGVFGPHVFVRLSEGDRARAAKVAGAVPFEPMEGRPMREYVVLPDPLLARRAEARKWVDLSFAFASSLPPKKAPTKPR